MSITTKTLATIMLVAMLTIPSMQVLASDGNRTSTKRQEKQLERLYKRHDRKLELRSSVLGIASAELKERLKTERFDDIVKRAGFKNKQAFHVALVGKLKNELRERGWNDLRIQHYISSKLSKYFG